MASNNPWTSKRFAFFASIIIVLLLSASISREGISFVAAQAQSGLGADWTSPAYDKFGTNFSPQNRITNKNVGSLKDDWFNLLPLAVGSFGYNLSRGSESRILVKDGIVYLASNFLQYFAYNAATGLQLWSYTYTLNITDMKVRIPSVDGYGAGRVRGISYFDGRIYIPTPDCGILQLDALSGSPILQRGLSGGETCRNVPGNEGKYTGQLLYGPVFYEKGGVLITGTSVSGKVSSGRGFVAGYDIQTGNLLWRFFLMPPAGGDPRWAFQWKGKGNVEPVEGDWGEARGVGVGVGAGQWAVDEESGVVYVSTSSPAPLWNATFRPGPNLFSSSLLALDAKTGELIWYYQNTPHDINGFGCDWNIILGKMLIQGQERKAVYKACGNGVVYAFDASNGSFLWKFISPSTIYTNVDDPSAKPDYAKPWENFPNQEPFWQCPSPAIDADMALAHETLYVAVQNSCNYLQVTSVSPLMRDSFGAERQQEPYPMPKNTTVYALDASTGRIKWSFSIDNAGYRGGIVGTSDLILAGGLDGNLYILEGRTGELVTKKRFGTPLAVPPSLASDARGKFKLFFVVGGQPQKFGGESAGFIISLSLVDDNESPMPLKDNSKAAQENSSIPIFVIFGALVLVVSITVFRIRKRHVKRNLLLNRLAE